MPQRFVATKSETGDLLYIEVSGQQDKVYVGQPLLLVVAQTVIHEGNGEAFAAKYQQPLREGAEFDVLQRRDDWLNIRTPDGQSGWIRGKDVEIIAVRT